jgi:hypothetical protein
MNLINRQQRSGVDSYGSGQIWIAGSCKHFNKLPGCTERRLLISQDCSMWKVLSVFMTAKRIRIKIPVQQFLQAYTLVLFLQ